jgi:protein subunit release factor A
MYSPSQVELADLAELAEMDPDMQDDVAIEVEELSSTRATLGKHLLSDLMNRAEAAEDAESREKNDSNSSNSGNSGNSGSSSGSSSEIEGAILEVRCGTGGDEAAMFASEILDM